MIILDHPQGSDAWLAERIGIPTASQFGRIITPKTGKLSASAEAYMAELIAESVCGSDPVFETYWMQRGKTLEPEAAARFAFDHGADPETVGFVLRDDRRAGCSPDRFLPGSGIEIKCPRPAKHVEYLLAGTLPDEHKAQVHGSMLICERDEWWFMSYCPGIRPLYVHVRRDAFTDRLGAVLDQFCDRLDELKAEVLE